MVRVALLLLIVVMATACSRKSAQTAESSVTVIKDSTIIKESLVIDTLFIPASEASAYINLDSLLSNYNGLLAKNSSGNATVTIVKEGRTIVATANCDSVMQLMISKITELEKIRNQQATVQRQKIVTVVPPWARKLQVGFWVIIIISGLAFTAFVIIKLKSVVL
jgi:hypothetical protein